jgi:hypothetical protein
MEPSGIMSETAAPAVATTATPVNPVFQAPPTGAPGGPAIPPVVPLTVDEYQRLRGIERDHAELTRQNQQALQKAEDARLKAIADKDGAEKALTEQKTTWEQRLAAETTKYQSLEQTLYVADKASTLSASLAGVTFAGETSEDKAETARQLRAILEPQFETSRDASGQIITREKGTGRPAAIVLQEAVASKKFSHFFAAQSRGGSGTDGTRSTATPPNAFQPGSLDAVAADYKARMGQLGSFGLTPLAPHK